jgi:peptidoglycan/xylan/chitin deacetylase (PgdA/CDA1 family)
MTSQSRTNTRRVFLGGAILAGACAMNPANAAGHGSGRSGGSGHRAISNPQHYRLRPETGVTPARYQASTEISYTLDATEGHEIALTFDDGPDPVYTPQVLEILRRYRVPATFCVLGESAAAYPGLLYAMAEGGHRIANHSWNHPQLTKLSAGDARRQLSRTSEVISKAVGTAPALSRAPYGVWNKETLEISAGLGMSPLGWSVDTCDWEQPGVAEIVTTVMDNVVPGSVVLQHDGGAVSAQTVDALRNYLPLLLDSGWTPVLPPVPGASSASGASSDRMRPAVT